MDDVTGRQKRDLDAQSARISREPAGPINLRYLLHDAIDDFTASWSAESWSPWQPEDVKHLARYLRDVLVDNGAWVAKAVTDPDDDLGVLLVPPPPDVARRLGLEP